MPVANVPDEAAKERIGEIVLRADGQRCSTDVDVRVTVQRRKWQVGENVRLNGSTVDEVRRKRVEFDIRNEQRTLLKDEFVPMMMIDAWREFLDVGFVRDDLLEREFSLTDADAKRIVVRVLSGVENQAVLHGRAEFEGERAVGAQVETRIDEEYRASLVSGMEIKRAHRRDKQIEAVENMHSSGLVRSTTA